MPGGRCLMNVKCSGLDRGEPADQEIRFATEAEADGCIEQRRDKRERRGNLTDDGGAGQESKQCDRDEGEADELRELRWTRVLGFGRSAKARAEEVGEQESIRCALQAAECAQSEDDGLQTEQDDVPGTAAQQGKCENCRRDGSGEPQTTWVDTG